MIPNARKKGMITTTLDFPASEESGSTEQRQEPAFELRMRLKGSTNCTGALQRWI